MAFNEGKKKQTEVQEHIFSPYFPLSVHHMLKM